MPSCLPHGAYTLCPAVLCTLAWLASLSQDGCDYSRLSGPVVEKITNSKDVPFVEIGFVAYRQPTFNADDKSWSVVYLGPCSHYDADLEDNFWKAAKALAFGALVLGGASALFLWFSSCFVFSRGTWRWAGYQVLLAFICQSLAFLWFGTAVCKDSANSCDLFYGSKADISAAVFWFVSAVMIFTRYPKPRPKFDESAPINSGQSEEATELELPVAGDPSARAEVQQQDGKDEEITERLRDVEIT